MKPYQIARIFIVPILLAALVQPVTAAAAEKSPIQAFNQDLGENYEVATVLDAGDSGSGSPAVLFTARKKKLKGAGWPVIYSKLNLTPGDAPDEAEYAVENWVVSLKDKKKLGLVQSKQPGFLPSYSPTQEDDGARSGAYSSVWGPNQEGWHYGILNYGARWGCSDLFLVNSDGTSAQITSIRDVLDAAVFKQAITGAGAKSYVVGYDLLGTPGAESSVTVTDPLVVKIGFLAQVPKSDDLPDVQGTMSLKLSRDAKGKAQATVLSLKTGGQSSAAVPEKPKASEKGKSLHEEYAAFRKMWNSKAEAGTWKTVRKDIPVKEKGRKVYVRGWVEANVLQRLMHVDSMGPGNEVITVYYWKEGQLMSVFELRKGAATQISEVGEATETYNFADEKLVTWFRTGDTSGMVGVNDPLFQETGERVLAESRRSAEPIYLAIGAD